MAKSYYELLGIDDDATIEDIRRAYRRVVRRYHPDLNPDKQSAARKSRQLNAALETLSDEKKRAKYDKKLARRRKRLHQADSVDERRTKEDSAYPASSPTDLAKQNRRQSDSDLESSSRLPDRDEVVPEVQPPSPAAGRATRRGNDDRFFETSDVDLDVESHDADFQFDHEVDSPTSEDDPFRYGSASIETEQFAPGPYERSRRANSNHGVWVAAGFAIVSVVGLIVVVAVAVSMFWGSDPESWSSPRTVMNGRAAIRNVSPNRTRPRTRPTAPRTGTTPTSRNPMAQGRFGPMDPRRTRPVADANGVIQTIDLLSKALDRSWSAGSDFEPIGDQLVSREDGIRMLQFPSFRPALVYELNVRVRRISEMGTLHLGVTGQVTRIAATVDGTLDGDLASGFENLPRKPAISGGVVDTQKTLLPVSELKLVTVKVNQLKSEFQLLIDGELIAQAPIIRGRMTMPRELEEMSNAKLLLATRDGKFAFESVELKIYDPQR